MCDINGKLKKLVIIFFFHLSMDNATAHEAAKMIVQTFPSEVVPTYFKPAIWKRDSATGKSQISRGKLIAKWRSRKSENKKLEGQIRR